MNSQDRLKAVIDYPHFDCFRKIENGNEVWRNKEGHIHRDNDLPAVIYNDGTGTKSWYKNGELHRDNDKPAVIDINGYQAWYQNGKLHRDNDKPAIIYSNEEVEYYRRGKKYESSR